MHTISQPIPPASCVDLRGDDALAAVRENDDVYWKSDLKGRDWSLDRDLRDGLVAEFPKPVDANSVKIVVSGKNTRLAYFALAKIFRLKGDDKLRWYGQLENDPAERSKFARWLMREGMLHIKVWQNDQWVEKSALPDVGPGVEKEQVAVVKINDVPGGVLKVKCECTTDLWRIDQVCVDYSPDGVITTTELSPRSAVNEQGLDVLGLLAASDERYYTTVNGQYAELVFADVPVRRSTQRSYVVRTKGFYYQWLTSEGAAQGELVERILSEPLFGTKVLMPQWIKERAQYEGIAQTIH